MNERAHRLGRATLSVPLLTAILLHLAACSDNYPTALDEGRSGWRLAWSDEFDGPAGQLPDPTKWRFDIGTDWGNAQLEFTTDRAENASLDGRGNLAIVARQESFRGQPFTAARITTQGLFEPQYGLIEARIRLPSGRGLWPAFWLLGGNIGTVGWPQSGEIDVMEFRGQEPSIIHGSLHGPGYSAGNAVTQAFALQGGRFDTDFFVFSVEWTRESIIWYVDGIPYREIRRNEVPGEWVFDQPFYIILNVAVGGTFVGPPGPQTVFPQTMLVDWVRVWERSQ
jgi:beta-glucanase (GH16 family)